MASFDIAVRTGASLHPDGEPDRFVSEYTAVVTCADDETGEVTKVGRIVARRVNAGLALEAGEPLYDVCDCHGSELHRLHALLYEPNAYHFSNAVVSRFDAFGIDLLVLDHVVLAPKWRGLRIGLLAVRKLVDLIGGGCGLAVSDIAPLRHDAAAEIRVPPRWLPAYATDDERRAATVRLRRYYRRMGFTRLGRTPYYALPLEQLLPTAADLLGPAGPR